MKWILLLSFVVLGCSSNKYEYDFKSTHYVITAEEDAASEAQAQYLYNHLKKRTKGKTSIKLHKGPLQEDLDEQTKVIHIEMAPDLKNDYCIKHNKNRIHLRMKSPEIGVWMTYQLISAIAEGNKDIEANDLLPSSVEFKSECRDFDFAYREPHLSSNLQEYYSQTNGNDNVELDWGLWGHNLEKIVAESDEQSEDIYAYVGNKRVKTQFSFSSPELFDVVKTYILDNYGDGSKKSYRFMISPNDNDLVCTCSSCTQLGNTKSSATPAVNDFIRKLAELYPKHQFFTTVYRTVQEPPSFQMAKNAGVFLSTIDLPKGQEIKPEHKSTKEFIQQFDAWKLKTPNLYLWDYAANFDDYLTPIPILYGMQKHLNFYKDIGVKGIFINANGYDYMPFDDVKTFVLSALLKNTHANVDHLVTKFFTLKYPKSSALLSAYYMKLEKDFAQKNVPYNMYGGFKANLNYLNPQDFLSFYEQLGNIIPQTAGTEKQNLEAMYTALTFTRLQILYFEGADKIKSMDQVGLWLNRLEGFKAYPSMQRYKESGGSLFEYIEEWSVLLGKIEVENLLKNSPINLISPPDEGHADTRILTDGNFGFASDYHQGWFLNSNKKLKLSFSAAEVQKGKTLKIQFLKNEKHHLLPPSKVELIADGKTLKTISKKDLNSNTLHLKTSFAGVSRVDLIFHPEKGKRHTIALDEILIY